MEEELKRAPVTQAHLEFLLDMHNRGVNVGKSNTDLLRERELIDQHGNKKIETATDIDHSTKTATELLADEQIDVIETDEIVREDEVDVFTEEEYEERLGDNNTKHTGKKDIKKSDWMPASILEHSPKFVAWIDSMLYDGFQYMKPYRPFQLYVQQAMNWAAENEYRADYHDPYDVQDFEDRELTRCSENTLYFLNKYLKLKEGSLLSGAREYDGTKAHQVICYLADCGYSFLLGKPRQIAATSTLGGIAMARLTFQKNFFIKFITQSDEKGEEIFNDKILWPFTELSDWMRPDVMNDRGTFIQLGKKTGKGKRSGVGSKLEVAAPTKTAISGGSPQLAMIDEVGNIPILTQIIQDGRPTMFWMNPLTKKMEMKRQLIAWGTSGDMDKGGKAFEGEFMSLIKAWNDRKFSSGIIPVFFDWTTRPGITQEDYDREKEIYYGIQGPSAEQSKVLFHQQYPASIAEMFMGSHKTLVSAAYISKQKARIRESKDKLQPKYGFFQPIYGNVPQPENSDTPYNIIGVNFVPTSGKEDPRTTSIIVSEPKRGWTNRYYQGTDPIASDNGVSKMASAIWDAYFQTPVAYVNFRSSNYKEVFLQVVLLGLYYDVENQVPKGAKELLEANIGLAYREYKDNKGFYKSLVHNAELPQYLQVHNSTLIGIDNRAGATATSRNKMIIDKLFELIQAYGERIYMDEFFTQLETFVCTINKNAVSAWGPIDKRHWFDDLLFAVVYSYICSICYSHKIPKGSMQEGAHKTKITFKTTYDKHWNLTRIPVKVKV